MRVLINYKIQFGVNKLIYVFKVEEESWLVYLQVIVDLIFVFFSSKRIGIEL